ncbi:MAG TPA: hypothetical protein VFJ82_20010 [Longimicrobium sp.]|nr:hypothetical protein [Longimicrobium sp.]
MPMHLRTRSTLLSIALAAALPAAAAAQTIHPVLDVQGKWVLGAPVNGVWRDGQAIARQVRAGRRYRVFGPASELGVSTGSRAESLDVPCPETFGVELSPERAGGEIAIDAAWNVVPRRVIRLSQAAADGYRDAVRQILLRHGIRDPDPRVTGAVRVDLDGDGTEEVIVSAHRQTADGTFHVGAGDYGIVFVRRLVAGTVRTLMVEEEYHPRAAGETTPNQFTIAGVYDLDGDGAMELVTRGRYYEGEWSTVYRLRGTTVRKLVSAGCGA